MHSLRSSRRRQTGAVIITVAFALLFLLGFMAIALDFGHLFVVKTELQTATDSCALAAAKNLIGPPMSYPRYQRGKDRVIQQGEFSRRGRGNRRRRHNFQRLANRYLRSRSRRFASLKYAKCVRTKAACRRGCCKRWALSAAMLLKSAPRRICRRSGTLASAQTSCMLPIGIFDQPGGFTLAMGTGCG